MYARTSTWIDRPSHETFELATDLASWPSWFDLVEPLGERRGRLADRGDRAPARIPALAGGRDLELAVDRRLRQIVGITAASEDGEVGRIDLSASPWHGGCMVEIAVAAHRGPRRWTDGRLRRRLRDALEALGRLTDAGDVPVAPSRWESAPVPRGAPAGVGPGGVAGAGSARSVMLTLGHDLDIVHHRTRSP